MKLNSLPRAWVWVQLAIAWLPMWAVFTALIMSAHGVALLAAMVAAARMIVPGALLGLGVYAFTRRRPWPHPFRLRFLGLHVIVAAVYACAWLAGVLALDHVVARHGMLHGGPGPVAFLMTGIWLYLVVAGVAYANSAAQRTAQLEAHAARVQLAQLRAQLHPHFLFNTLHAIVQLIPEAPRRAAQAAEELAGVLRRVIEEERDLVPLAEELAFVERYLGIEQLRFGARLQLARQVEAAALDALVPVFALQTLAENAVRHGAAPKIGATTLTLAAAVDGDVLVLSVRDDGVGAQHEDSVRAEDQPGPAAGVVYDSSRHMQAEGHLGDDGRRSGGTGLRRLRERLHWQFGARAQLRIDTAPGAGFTATLILPLLREAAAAQA